MRAARSTEQCQICLVEDSERRDVGCAVEKAEDRWIGQGPVPSTEISECLFLQQRFRLIRERQRRTGIKKRMCIMKLGQAFTAFTAAVTAAQWQAGARTGESEGTVHSGAFQNLVIKLYTPVYGGWVGLNGNGYDVSETVYRKRELRSVGLVASTKAWLEPVVSESRPLFLVTSGCGILMISSVFFDYPLHRTRHAAKETWLEPVVSESRPLFVVTGGCGVLISSVFFDYLLHRTRHIMFTPPRRAWLEPVVSESRPLFVVTGGCGVISNFQSVHTVTQQAAKAWLEPVVSESRPLFVVTGGCGVISNFQSVHTVTQQAAKAWLEPVVSESRPLFVVTGGCGVLISSVFFDYSLHRTRHVMFTPSGNIIGGVWWCFCGGGDYSLHRTRHVMFTPSGNIKLPVGPHRDTTSSEGLARAGSE
ncbi:hypothetical protein J6590_033785 [Homalodisca vitripennis]|nr:hypothetical protein J6590_033785 [Homalodisca vitripennis]